MLPRLALALLAVSLLLPASAFGVRGRAVERTVDLLLEGDVQIDGAANGHNLGEWLASGDVNGDGNADLAVAADNGIQVVFGPLTNPLLDAGTIGAQGFFIRAEAIFLSVDMADVNGDGRDDVIIGNPNAARDAGGFPGVVYAVFGKADAAEVDVRTPAPTHFKIEGSVLEGRFGHSVGGVLDMNGDGRAEMVIGAPDEPAAYVVFGKADTATLGAGSLGTGGYRLDEAQTADSTGEAVSGAGDVNNDGGGDILVAAPTRDGALGANTGGMFVVFGKANTTPLDLGSLGSAGYAVDGAGTYEGWGDDVANAGDVNNDGRPDAIVSSTDAAQGAGGAAVVFGRSTTATVRLDRLGRRGFTITGPPPVAGVATPQFGDVVAGRGDINDDGRGDMVIGGPRLEMIGRDDAGSAYVVYGKSSTTAVDLASLTEEVGYRIDGPAAEAEAGGAVDTSRNVFGNAGQDVIVGAKFNSANGRAESGSAYVIDGPPRDDSILDDVDGGAEVEQSSNLRAAARSSRIRYRLTRAADVTLNFVRLGAGRRTAIGRCSAESRKNRKNPRCVRPSLAGRVVRKHGASGAQSYSFNGRLKGKRVPAGNYVLAITAREPNGRVWGPSVIRLSVRR